MEETCYKYKFQRKSWTEIDVSTFEKKIKKSNQTPITAAPLPPW